MVLFSILLTLYGCNSQLLSNNDKKINRGRFWSCKSKSLSIYLKDWPRVSDTIHGLVLLFDALYFRSSNDSPGFASNILDNSGQSFWNHDGEITNNSG